MGNVATLTQEYTLKYLVLLMMKKNMMAKQKHIVIIIFMLSSTSAKVGEWPIKEMSKILFKSCSTSENCSEEIFSKILNDCVDAENKMENFLDSFGYITDFRRTTTETKEISKLFMTSLRMKKDLKKLASQRKLDMRSYETSIDKIVDEFCDKLTNELRVCDEPCDSNSRFRTITGCCNNLQNSDFGASFVPFTRLLPAEYDDAESLPRGGLTSSSLPSPRKVSTTVHQVIKRTKEQTKFSLMVMQFGQFLDHDLTLSPEQERECTNPDVLSRDQAEDEALRVCFNIDVDENDVFYANRIQALPLTRSDGICHGEVREQFNALTAFIDGSQIYGSDDTLSKQLRTLENGLLKVHRLGPTMPTRSQTGLLDEHFRSEDLVGGDIRAIEQPGLASLHSLFVNEHNRIAKEIQQANQELNDEDIFQEARRFVIAELQNIVYNEFLPTVLGADLIKDHKLKLDEDETTLYHEAINPAISNEFATFAFRFGHTLVPNFLRTRGDPIRTNSVLCPIKDNFFKFEQFVLGKDYSGRAWENLLFGLSTTESQPFSPKISDHITNYLYCGTNCNSEDGFGEDLAARNIQRGRDHGIPGYTKYRKLCGLSVPSSWNDKPTDISQQNWDNLKLVYNSVTDIDAFTGGVSEDSIPDGVVGRTFGCILANQFQNLIKGDRFFFTHKENGIKKEKGWSINERKVSQIHTRKLSDIMCDNMDFESIPQNIFQSKSDLMSCNEKTKLRLNSQTKDQIVKIKSIQIKTASDQYSGCHFSSCHLKLRVFTSEASCGQDLSYKELSVGSTQNWGPGACWSAQYKFKHNFYVTIYHEGNDGWNGEWIKISFTNDKTIYCSLDKEWIKESDKRYQNQITKPCLLQTASGIFIPGGWSDESGKTALALTTSLYIPSKKQFCKLPNVPTDRFGHTTIGFTSCGGWEYENNNCYTFNTDKGEWELSHNFKGRHAGHVAWQTSEGLALVGGWGNVYTSILGPNGAETIIKYESDYEKWTPCGIPDPETETIIITGGNHKNSTGYYQSSVVNRYDKHGKRERLPNMNIPRWLHACSSYKNDKGKTVLLVVGGYAGTEKTETLEIGDAKWKIHEDVGISSFLRPAAVTLNNKIFVIARYLHKIVVWNPAKEKYETETEMKYWRSANNGQFASVVNVDENFVKKWC